MSESKGKPEEVFIDFGAGSCTAACNHCLFGLDKKKEIVTPQQLRLYELVETYAKERDAFVSTGLMDPIETFEGDLSFIKYAESVRISTRDIMTYFQGFETGQGVAKIKSVLGSALGVPWSLAVSVHTENSPARFLSHNDMVSIFALQIKLAEVCDADIAFGFRTNRSDESTEQVFQSMQRMGRRYRKAIKEFLPDADVKMRSLKRDGLASLSVQVRLGEASRVFELGGRFIHSKYTKEETEAADADQEKNGIFTLALFPREVHACHTTMNINDKTLRFDYSEMTDLLQEARTLGVNASTLLFKKIRERRARKVFPVAVVI